MKSDTSDKVKTFRRALKFGRHQGYVSYARFPASFKHRGTQPCGHAGAVDLSKINGDFPSYND